MNAPLSVALTENLVTILAFNDEAGKIVSSLLDPALCEGELRVIAERCIEYWKKHGTAPKVHVADLVTDKTEDPQSKQSATYKRILAQMWDLRDDVNTDYVLSQLRMFTRMQQLKTAVVASAEQLNARQHLAIEEVEQIWSNLMRVHGESFETGMRLTDIDRLLHYLTVTRSEFTTGVRVLDKAEVVPFRGAMFLILGPTGTGKSWMCVHIGRQAIEERKRVLHVTLEMSEEQVAQRYLQGLFSIAKRGPNQRSTVRLMKKDTFDRVQALEETEVLPSFTFQSPLLVDELVNHLSWGGKRYDNLVIKRFPPRTLTCDRLRGYLDALEASDKFIPDLLIVDYLGLMKIDMREARLSLGNAGMELRGLAVERNLALVVPQQVSRVGAAARTVSHLHVAEDWSLTNTADQVVTISQTKAEKALGLSRLLASKVRDEESGIICVITQNLRMGQFCLDSARLTGRYEQYVEEMMKAADDDQDEDEEEGGD